MKMISSARASLQATLSPLDFAHVCSTIESKASKYKDRISFKLDKKFNNLKKKYLIPQLSNLSNTWPGPAATAEDPGNSRTSTRA